MSQSNRTSGSVAMDDYLEQILHLIEDKGYARPIDLSDKLGLSQASVTNMLLRLDEQGWVKHEKYRGTVLTEKGREIARAIIDRHASLERFLNLFDLDEATIYKDVEGMEHHVSNATLNVIQSLTAELEADPELLKRVQKSDATVKFENFIGIDYSGAKTPTSPLPGIRVFLATAKLAAKEIRPDTQQPRRHWSRASLHDWLLEFLNRNPSTLVGIDHGLSFPIDYLEQRKLKTWAEFISDFDNRWPQLSRHSVDDCLKSSPLAAGYENPTLLRLCETWIPGPTSVFRTVGQGSVGKSTFSGLAQLLSLIKRCDNGIHTWPFDGWQPATGQPVIAEVYPSLWRRRFTDKTDGTTDQRDAKAVACWMRRQQHLGELSKCFTPLLTAEEKSRASLEGWILGAL